MRGRGVVLGVVAAVTLLAGAPPVAGAPPTTPPAGATPTTAPVGTTPSTVPQTTGVPDDAAGAAEPATTVALPAIPRAGSAIGDLEKRPPPPWSVLRIAVSVGLAVVGLAILGHLYGRLRSIPPRRPRSTALARTD